jgi:hypothetical protein
LFAEDLGHLNCLVTVSLDFDFDFDIDIDRSVQTWNESIQCKIIP